MHITVFRANQLYYYSKTACKEKSAEIRAAPLPESASGSAISFSKGERVLFLASERERVRLFEESTNALSISTINTSKNEWKACYALYFFILQKYSLKNLHNDIFYTFQMHVNEMIRWKEF